jgi:peptidoglycan/xylan/chitin deacetylase (PgdA/CDA1 family)
VASEPLIAPGRRRAQRLLGPVAGSLMRVRTAEKAMALTFDDGPDPAATPRLLDVLARQGMRATFFVIGARAVRHPDLVARMIAEGHEIGNHSWDHPSLPTLSAAGVAAQIRRTRAALAPHGQRLLRPPYGHQTLGTHLIARRYGYRVVIWSLSGADWSGEDAGTLLARIRSQAAPGAIVLLHDSLCTWMRPEARDRGPTLAAVAALPEQLPDYRFVTVSELLGCGRPEMRYWSEAPDRVWLAGLESSGA